VVKAVRAVLPHAATLLVVGGVTADNAIAFQQAGANGFGVGGSIYRAGTTAEQTGRNAATFTKVLRPQ
jgi:2-dehydro-3-deoxyphosphogalactonate aldolase